MHCAMLSALSIGLRAAQHLPLWGTPRGYTVSVATVSALRQAQCMPFSDRSQLCTGGVRTTTLDKLKSSFHQY